MIEAHALVVGPTVTQVAPKRPPRPFGLELAQGVGPSLVQQTPIGCTGLGLQERVRLLVMALVNIRFGRHDIVIARKDSRNAGRYQPGSVIGMRPNQASL